MADQNRRYTNYSNYNQNPNPQYSQPDQNNRVMSPPAQSRVQTPKEIHTFEDAIRALLDHIRRSTNNLVSLNNFFGRFDNHEQRTFAPWEFEIMFNSISKQQTSQIFQLIHQRNVQKAQLMQNQVTLQFLIDEMELMDKNLVRCRLNQNSIYQTAPVNPNLSGLLNQLAQNREIRYDPCHAFNNFFGGKTEINHNLLDRALRDQRIQYELAWLADFVSYLAQDRVSSSFNQIQWVQGLRPWIDGKRQEINMQQPVQNWQYQTMQPSQQFGFQPPPQGWGQQTMPQQPYQQAVYQNQNAQIPVPYVAPQGPTNTALNYQQYDPIISRFNMDLHLISDGAHKRHTGIYKWFQAYSSNGTTLWQQEFSKAVASLNVQGVNSQNEIFSALQFNGPQMPVQITDIAKLFKAFGARNMPKINTDQVYQQILKAFNADEAFINNGLQKDAKVYPNNTYTLDLDLFVKFFSQWEQHRQYYNLDDITILGDVHSSAQQDDSVSVGGFIKELTRVRQQYNIMPDLRSTGIQHTLVAQGDRMGSMNSLQPGFSGDCTKAAFQPGLRPPNYFRPHHDEKQVSEIIKGCFIKKKFVQEHFSDLVQGGNIKMYDFVLGLNNLGVSWSQTESEKIFKDIDQSMNGVQQGNITAADIDSYIHFSKYQNVAQLHNGLMELVEKRVSERKVNLDSEFTLRSRAGQDTCSHQDFKDVIRNLALGLDDRDVNFMAMPYTNQNEFQFRKFCDDITQLQRLSQQIQLSYGPVDDASKIAEALKKALYVYGSDFETYWTQVSLKPLSQFEFVQALERLNLIPPFNQQQFSQIYMQMDGSMQQEVHSLKIIAYFQSKCQKHPATLLADLLRKWQGQNVEQFFVQNPDFQRTGTMRMNEFEIILGDRLKYSRHDAQFISKYFGVGGDIDVRKFIAECGTTTQVGETAADVIRQITTALTTKKIDLNYQLSQYRIGNSLSISVQDFQKVYSQICNLNEVDRVKLEKAYTSSDGAGKIDYIRFQEDVKKCQPDFDQVSLTRDQQRVYDETRKQLTVHKLSQNFCNALTQQDYYDSGYMTRNQILNAFNTVLAAISSNPKPKMEIQNLDIMLSVINTNQKGEFQWKQFVQRLFERDGDQLLKNSQASGNKNNGSANQVNMMTGAQPSGQSGMISPQLAVNSYMGALGRKIGLRSEDFANLLMRNQKSLTQGCPMVTQEDAIKCMEQLNVQFEVDERIAFQRYCMESRDHQNLINAYSMMKAIGLKPPETQANKLSQKKILQEHELMQSHQFLMLLRKEAMAMGKRPEDIINNYRRGSPTETTMSAKAFHEALKAEFSQSPTVGPKLKSQSTIVNVVHYLVREETFRVSYSKLLEAFSLNESSQPLKQEGIDDIVKYSTQLQSQLTQTKIPLSVIELNAFMKKNGLSLQALLEQPASNNLSMDMSVSEFEKHLEVHGYTPKEMPELLKAIQNNETGKTKVSISLLQKQLRILLPSDSKDPKAAQQKYGKMTPVVRSKIQQISDYMQNKSITLEELHKNLDTNGDGVVDKQEFIEGISRVIMLPSLTRQDLGTIFDAIDLNNDKSLSLNEFSYYLQGAKLKKEQKKAKIDPATISELQTEISALFMQLSLGKNYVTGLDIFKVMQGLNQNTSMDKANEMIRAVDKNNDGNIDLQEFTELLLPIMQDQLVAEDDQLEDMRAKFREADVDYSGFLSVDEFYACLLGMGADVSRNEVINMFIEFDANQDMQIDIDEFISFFSVGEQIQFQDEKNVNTYMKIKKARKLKPSDFLKVFNSMPQTFTPSFFTERWTKNQRNLPSSSFRAQIDPKTMLYKDMAPVQTEMLTSEQMKAENRPRLRPVQTQIGTQITIESATGVPLPKNTADFNRDNIVKRVVRVGLFDEVKKELIHNSAFVVAEWNQNNEDIWSFQPAAKNESLNPILFRSTQKDDLNRQEIQFIFELVVYVAQDGKTSEWTAGWATTPLSTCERDVSKVRLEIQGGNPRNNIAIQKDDLQTKRTGINYLQKVFTTTATQSTLFVSFKPSQYLEAETKYHLELLPSTCFVQKKLLNFVSGYRNYAAEQLLPSLATDSQKKPLGNIVMSSFPKILDSPDIVEVLAQFWWEDHMAPLNVAQKKSVELAMKKMEQVVNRIYPVLYSDEFEYRESEATQSMCGRASKLLQRKNLLTSAIRYQTGKTTKGLQSLEMLTTFKPFNVREIEYDVWEDHRIVQA